MEWRGVMFLKRIEMKGFKSFADREIIHFDHNVTAIVGPNGCGKSNISDAIRWVLGEQSVKSMRGDSMTDVIFNGSESRRSVNLAEVTLVFDNSQKILNSDFEEVEITRRLYRDTRESQYLINKTKCRLRDVHDLVLDTGLGRDSLSIISQGTISHFAEAKPDERRLVFEEAAGVARYKQRKMESIRKLERTKENIERMQDIVDEIEKQTNRLEKAAKKAEQYLKLQGELEKLEISALVSDIRTARSDIEREQQTLFALEADLASLETKQGVYDHRLVALREEMFNLDQTVNQKQARLMRLVEEISSLEKKQIQEDEKQKYSIEQGNDEEKISALQETKKALVLEIEERRKRYESLETEIEFILKEQKELLEKKRLLEEKEASLDASIQKLEKDANFMEHQIQRPYDRNVAVQTIMEHKDHLMGIHDVVAKLIVPQDGYEQAIQTSLGGLMMNVVTETDEAAVAAINFLKKNRAGRATFIPLNRVFARNIHEDALTIAKHDEGFLGVASDLVDYDPIYETLIQNVLGNVLISENIDSANRLSRKLNNRYQIVTLEGDVLHRGGFLSGGYRKNQGPSILSLEKSFQEVSQKLKALRYEKASYYDEKMRIQKTAQQHEQKLMELRLNLAKMQPLLSLKETSLQEINEELAKLDAVEESKPDYESAYLKISQAISQKKLEREELTTSLSLDRERRMELSRLIKQDEEALRSLGFDIRQKNASIQEIRLRLERLQANERNALDRLSSEYQMTYDYALDQIYDKELVIDREKIQSLKHRIQKLGNINLAAPEEYAESKKRYDFITGQLQDLLESREKLLSFIDELDEIMVEKFEDMFYRVNDELDEVFTALFGGGKARLVLEDPDDLLNSGVDIDVQPPGKSVQNIRLFSGGEKSLIAISVLFSIIKARHVPLCVFDEVEAALDQANVERFADYVQNLSHKTQFIIITHRPGTMERSDVLYGVTMPSKGVSTMLKVELEEAIGLREE